MMAEKEKQVYASAELENHLFIDQVVGWITEYCDKNKLSSLVVGVSGGIDSAVVARLCEKTGLKTFCVAMPMNTSIKSFSRAKKLCYQRNVEFSTVCIERIVNVYKQLGVGDTSLREGNLRSRIRANILYDLAGKNFGIVVGTGNKDEDEIGYFTKGGDGLVDICPLSNVHKSKVLEIACVLDNIPQNIIDAEPTAELEDGQTDDQDLGMTYNEIEWAIKFDDPENIHMADESLLDRRRMFVLEHTRYMRKYNAHKLKLPPIFKLDTI